MTKTHFIQGRDRWRLTPWESRNHVSLDSQVCYVEGLAKKIRLLILVGLWLKVKVCSGYRSVAVRAHPQTECCLQANQHKL